MILQNRAFPNKGSCFSSFFSSVKVKQNVRTAAIASTHSFEPIVLMQLVPCLVTLYQVHVFDHDI